MLTLTQTDVYIPVGTGVECNGWAKALHNDPGNVDNWLLRVATSFSLFIDGEECANWQVYKSGTSDWESFESFFLEISNGDYHTVDLRMYTRPSGGLTEGSLDDLRIDMLYGPGAWPCGSPYEK